jgi:hypothetical protein
VRRSAFPLFSDHLPGGAEAVGGAICGRGTVRSTAQHCARCSRLARRFRTACWIRADLQGDHGAWSVAADAGRHRIRAQSLGCQVDRQGVQVPRDPGARCRARRQYSVRRPRQARAGLPADPAEYRRRSSAPVPARAESSCRFSAWLPTRAARVTSSSYSR